MKLSLQDLIYLSKQTDNIIITKWLEDLEKLIVENSNDQILVEKVRKCLK